MKHHPVFQYPGVRCFFMVLFCMLAAACSVHENESDRSPTIPAVRTIKIEHQTSDSLGFSGTVKARTEVPLAFQMGGRILARYVVAGQRVRAGQRLLSLDPRDLMEAQGVASAQLAASEAALATATAELTRQRALMTQHFISEQGLQRYELNVQEAAARRDVARANESQARNAREYADLAAPYAGVLMELDAVAGQVVSPGTPLGWLARDGMQEVEVFLPDTLRMTANAVLVLDTGVNIPLRLAEMAGAADPISRTWRARFRIPEKSPELALGSIVRVQVEQTAEDSRTNTIRVPLAALDERGRGPQIWQVVQGKAEPLAVKLLSVTDDGAKIVLTAPLSNKAHIISMGTHLLTPGMAVRDLAE